MAAPAAMANALNELFHTQDNIFLFFTVEGSNVFSGCCGYRQLSRRLKMVG